MSIENKCQILDDDEMEKVQSTNRFNFRRFDSEEIERRSSPFEKNQKKEFPFLLKKKPTFFRKEDEEKKVCIEDLMNSASEKISKLKLDENGIVDLSQNAMDIDSNNAIDSNDAIDSNNAIDKEYVSHTPEWPKTREELEAIHQEHVEYYANLKKMEIENTDGKQ